MTEPLDLIPYILVAGIVVLTLAVYKLSQFSKEPDGWWASAILEGRRVRIRTDWNLCMGSASCTELAPKIFRLDWSKKKSIFDPAPLEVHEDRGTRAEDIFRAAQSCPYRAIILVVVDSGERIFPQ